MKTLLQSKTILVNVVAIFAMVADAVFGLPFVDVVVNAKTLAVANILLRLVTKTGVKLEI